MANAAGHSSTQAARRNAAGAWATRATVAHARASFPGPRVRSASCPRPHAAQAVTEPSRLGPRPLAFYLGQAAAAPEPATARERFLRGVRAYWAIPIGGGRAAADCCGKRVGAAARLSAATDHRVLVLPSLINRAEVLDLLPERSLLAHLAASGFRPLAARLGRTQGTELQPDAGRSHPWARGRRRWTPCSEVTGQRPVLLGYCLGGLLATAWPRRGSATSPAWRCWRRHGTFHAAPTAARRRPPLAAYGADRHPGLRAGRSAAGLLRASSTRSA